MARTLEAAFAEAPNEPCFRLTGQVADGLDAVQVELFGGLGADAPELAHRQGGEEGRFSAGRNYDEAVGFFQVGGDFGDGLAGADADGDVQAGFVLDLALEGDADGAGEMAGFDGGGNVEIGFVQGHGFHQVGEAVKDVHDLAGHFPVAVKAGADDDALGTLADGGGHGHGGADAKGAGLVGSGGDNAADLGAAADHDGLAPQFRVVQLLYGGVEGVQVGVDDVAHLAAPGSRFPPTRERRVLSNAEMRLPLRD